MLFETIKYKNKKIRKYNEKNISIKEVFIIETEIKWKELIKNEKLKLFEIECKNNTELSLNLREKIKKDSNNKSFYEIDENNIINKKIKENQKKDLIYLYSKRIFEIIYIVPKIEDKQYYFFNLIVFLKKEKDVNKIIDKNFITVKIEKIREIKENEINYNKIKNLLEVNQKIIYRNLPKNINLKTEKKFNEKMFSSICIHIYSFDTIKNKNESYEKYGLNFIFATNFYDITKFTSYNKNAEIERENLFISCLSENFDILDIYQKSFEN